MAEPTGSTPSSGELIPTKVCRKCGVPRLLTEFDRHPQMADGHLNICQPCTRARQAVWSSKPDVKIRLQSQAAARRAADPDRGREGRQAADRRFSKSPKGRIARKRRRLDELAAKLGYEAVNLQHVLDRDGHICHICIALGKSVEDAAIDPRYVTFDHIIPIVKPHYGPHTLENLAPAHKRCNSWKRDRLMEQLGGLEPPGSVPVDELLMRFRREAQSRSLKEFYANRDKWTVEQTADWDERNRQLSASMQGNQRGLGGPGRTGQPWTDEERATHIAAVERLIEDGAWQASLAEGQQRRRQRERDEGLPAFSVEGAARMQEGLAQLRADPERAAAMSAKMAAAKLGTKASEDTKAKMSESHKRAYATGARKPVNPKLTEEIVRIIRAEWAYGKSRELAERFGVSVSLIQDVANGKRWSHVA